MSKKKKQKKIVKSTPKQEEVVVFQDDFKSRLKAHDFDIRLVSVPLILGMVLAIVTLLANDVRSDLNAKRIAQSATVEYDPYVFINKSIQPVISAESAIIMDSGSKVVLYEKNPNIRFSMASTTKLMTALVGKEYFKPKDVLTVTIPDPGGQTLSFQIGDQIYFEDLLYAMMLPSSNHAAFIIASNFPGGMPAFVEKMNEKASELHLSQTHYIDPAGLNDDGNYTTAVDLSRLAAKALEDDDIVRITGTKSKIITNVAGNKTYSLTNLNELLGQYGVTGLKTGYTEGAKGVLATSAVVNGRTFVIVVMRSEARFADTQVLLSLLGSDITIFNPKAFSDFTQ